MYICKFYSLLKKCVTLLQSLHPQQYFPLLQRTFPSSPVLFTPFSPNFTSIHLTAEK